MNKCSAAISVEQLSARATSGAVTAGPRLACSALLPAVAMVVAAVAPSVMAVAAVAGLTSLPMAAQTAASEWVALWMAVSPEGKVRRVRGRPTCDHMIQKGKQHQVPEPLDAVVAVGRRNDDCDFRDIHVGS